MPLMTTPLDRLDAGRTMTVSRITHADPVTVAHLNEMGFDEGVAVTLLHRAPFGADPIAVQVGAMTVALRRALASTIMTVAPSPAE